MNKFARVIVFGFLFYSPNGFSASIYDSCVRFDRIENLTERQTYCKCFQDEINKKTDVSAKTKSNLASIFTFNFDEALGLPRQKKTPSKEAEAHAEFKPLLSVYKKCMALVN